MSGISGSSNQVKVNIDQLEKEIGKAVDYLDKSGVSQLKKVTTPTAAPATRSSFDDKRRADILIQLGRVPIDQPNSSTSSAISTVSTAHQGSAGSAKFNPLSKSSPNLTSNKYADPEEREKLVVRLLADHAAKKTQQQEGLRGTGSSKRIPGGEGQSAPNPNPNPQRSQVESNPTSPARKVYSNSPSRGSNLNSNSNSPSMVANFDSDKKEFSPDSIEENEQNRSAYSDDDYNSQNNSGLLFFASDLIEKSGNDKGYSDLNMMNWESFPSTISNHGSNVDQSGQIPYSKSQDKDSYLNSTQNISADRKYNTHETAASKHRYSSDSVPGNEDLTMMMETLKWPSADNIRHDRSGPVASLAPPRNVSANKTQERPRSAPSRRVEQRDKVLVTVDDANVDSRSKNSDYKYLKSKEVLQKEAEISFRKDYIFKPQLIAEYNSSALARRDPNSRMDEIRDQYHNSLINRERRKKEEERLQLLEFTGKPQITRKAEELLKKRESAKGESRLRDDSVSSRLNKDVSERLHEDAHARIVTQEYLKKSVDEARRNQFRFQPSLNPNNEAKVSPDYKPIYERISEVQKEKQYRLHQLKATLEDQQTDLTFVPKIDANSAKMMRAKSNAAANPEASGVESAESILNRHKNFGARLMQEGMLLSKHKQKLIEDQEKREAEMMLPPKVSKGSEAIASKRQDISVPFDRRREIYDEKSKLNAHRIRQEIDKEGSSWFKPSILSKSEKLVYKMQPDRENESPTQRDKRLSQWDMMAIEQKKKMLEEELYGDIKFAPTIDKNSKEMARKTDFRELVENNKGKKARDMVRQKVEEIRGADCPFRPQITDYFEKAISKGNASQQILENELRHFGYNECPTDVYNRNNRSNDDPNSKANLLSRVTINLKQPERMAGNIRHYLQEREEKRRQAIIERELDDLRDCTFQPQVDPYAFKRKESYLSEEPIIVRGLGRHLELKNRTEKLKEDAATREREVFSVRNVEKIRRPEDGSTIVEPFSFSEISFRPSRAVEELMVLEQSHLTYKPDTLEHRRQELIRRHTALMT